jgi:hypothetical protein
MRGDVARMPARGLWDQVRRVREAWVLRPKQRRRLGRASAAGVLRPGSGVWTLGVLMLSVIQARTIRRWMADERAQSRSSLTLHTSHQEFFWRQTPFPSK